MNEQRICKDWSGPGLGRIDFFTVWAEGIREGEPVVVYGGARSYILEKEKSRTIYLGEIDEPSFQDKTVCVSITPLKAKKGSYVRASFPNAWL